MSPTRTRHLGGCAILALAMLLSTGCGGPDEAGAAARRSNDETAATAPRANERPGDDIVRIECNLCSCAFFSGDGKVCARPSCKHDKSDHG